MAKKLKDYFPMIWERQEVLKEISDKQHLKEEFHSWSREKQEKFLDLCTGVRGLKLLYDGFFKEVMNPKTKPQRMNDFLSQILKQEVKVLQVLPADSTRLGDESSLVIMDIVVELADGSIANVEVQRIGYLFPGQRCACYSADLLLRQYKRVRDQRKKAFSYRDIKSVYTIVLFEHSPAEFKKFPGTYYHCFEQKSDTGIEIDFLQRYIMISLDIYRENVQYENIANKLDAWLALFSTEDPEAVIRLINCYPEFQEIYEEAYRICQNMENVMRIFSEELYELDKNTIQYMIDEMQSKIDEQKAELNRKDLTLDNQEKLINESITTIIELKRKLNFSDEQILEDLQAQYHLTSEQADKYMKQ